MWSINKLKTSEYQEPLLLDGVRDGSIRFVKREVGGREGREEEEGIIKGKENECIDESQGNVGSEQTVAIMP